VAKDLLATELDSASCLVASFAGQRAIWFFVDYKHSKLDPAVMEMELAKTQNGFQLKIKAKNLIRDLLVMIDKLDPDASIDKGLLTLLPGEVALFEIQSKKKLAIDQFSVGRVIRSANELVAR